MYFYILKGSYSDNHTVTKNELSQREFIPGSVVVMELDSIYLYEASLDLGFRLTNVSSYRGGSKGFFETTVGISLIGAVSGFVAIVLILLFCCCFCCKKRDKAT